MLYLQQVGDRGMSVFSFCTVICSSASSISCLSSFLQALLSHFFLSLEATRVDVLLNNNSNRITSLYIYIGEIL